MKDPIKPDTGKTYTGYYLYARGKDCFILTDYKSLSKPFINHILEQVIGVAPNESFRAEVRYYIMKNCTLTFSESERGTHYTIKGNNFIYGDFMDSGKLRLYEVTR